MIEKKSKKITINIFANIFLFIAAICCIIPFWTIVVASFSDEHQIALKGFNLIVPRGFSLEAYKTVFTNPEEIIDAYILTTIITIVDSSVGVFLCAMAGYPLIRRNYQWKKYINFFFYFTMIFSGGSIASYLFNTQILHLKNNVLIYFLPSLVSAWNIFMLRTYMSQVPAELFDAAKIDGLGEFSTFLKIVLPMSTVGLATIFVMEALIHWNQWYNSLMYFSDDNYVTLQYYLMRVMSNINDILKQTSSGNSMVSFNTEVLPSETTRMAICTIAAGPMIFVFSFFQKYFVGGIAVGSVKG